MKKMLIRILIIAFIGYVALCGLLYFFQEKLIFFPEKLSSSYKFNYDLKFEEFNTLTHDEKSLHGILFKADSAKGLIFYLHGNAGSLASWGNVASAYTHLDYDVFILDYRGYGKSDGEITSQNQLYSDNQLVYNKLKESYSEDSIIVLGYSIGTGMASKLASDNSPKQLILQAPYYSLKDMMRHTYSFVPTFLLKYQFETNEYLKDCNAPVTIFHGNKDAVIYYGSSEKLKKDYPDKISLITLEGQGHNGMTDNENYRKEIKNLLQPPFSKKTATLQQLY